MSEKTVRIIPPEKPNIPTRKRVCAYARVSTGHEAQLLLLKAQMTDLTPIFQAVISLAALAVTVILIPLIRSKLTDAQYRPLQSAISVGVFAAEQIYKGSGRGTEKKGYVLKFLQERGYTYDVGAIDAMIEAAVKQLNIAQAATGDAVPH